MVTGVERDRILPSGGMMIALSVTAILTLMRATGGTPTAQAMFSHSEWEEFRSGFQEVSEDLEGWYEGAKDLDLTDIRLMTARNIALWATDEELVEVYRFRSEFFAEIAPDPKRQSLCSFDALQNERTRYPRRLPEAMTPFLRVAGRSMARMHERETPWEPVVELVDDDRAWQEFLYHLEDQGLEQLVELFLRREEEEIDIGREAQCLLQAGLYGDTAERPDRPIGDGRLLDFVRELEILTTEES